MADEENVVVSAVGTATSVSMNVELRAKLEKAMSDAVTQALADGVSINDSEEIRRRILEARDAALG
ncbi:MAG TPA: hypothetical protein VJ777_16205 [Mycobacterium sp.]|nr:hypothetical protein [Mycobacterium sp.]